MSYRGKIKNGMVVFPMPTGLPEGAEVSVEAVTRSEAPPVTPPATPPQVPQERGPDDNRTWAEILGDLIGSVDGLPEDLAAQHDHYLRGTPKR